MKQQRRNRGAALLLALIIVALIATAAAGMVWQQTRAVNVEAAERARSQGAWILNAALDWARLILREDQRGGQQNNQPHDTLGEPWAQPLAEARLSSFLAADKDNNADSDLEAFISGGIEDAQSRFNLRGLLDVQSKVVPAQLKGLQALAAAAGAPSDSAERIATALALALGPPSETGADAAQLPIRPTQVGDLAWLGIDEPTLARLAPFIELLPTPTPVNLNTAPREVLVAAIEGLDLGGAERLVQARARNGFKSLEEAKAQLPDERIVLDPARASVTTSHFIVSGRLRLEDRVLEERSLLVRRDNRVDLLRRERRSLSAGLAR